jgi:hypothetical protein
MKSNGIAGSKSSNARVNSPGVENPPGTDLQATLRVVPLYAVRQYVVLRGGPERFVTPSVNPVAILPVIAGEVVCKNNPLTLSEVSLSRIVALLEFTENVPASVFIMLFHNSMMRVQYQCYPT